MKLLINQPVTLTGLIYFHYSSLTQTAHHHKIKSELIDSKIIFFPPELYSLFDILSNTFSSIYDLVRLLRIEFIHILIEYDNRAI